MYVVDVLLPCAAGFNLFEVELMRLFISINFTDETKSHLENLQNHLRGRYARGNFSSRELMHLSIVFLGECDEKDIAVIKEVMNNTNFRPFDITIERTGRFWRNNGDIWWAGVGNSKQLLDLQRNLRGRLASRGFKFERKEYNPHITLGREVKTVIRPMSVEPFSERVNAIYLMKSERIDGNLIYTPIHKKAASPPRS